MRQTLIENAAAVAAPAL